MRKQFLFGMILASVLGTASGATLVSENFEGATTGFGAAQTAAGPITGTVFTLVSGSIDINGPGVGGYGQLCAPTASSKCIDTTGGGTGGRGTIESTAGFTFLQNVQYLLSFSLVRWNDNNGGNVGGAGPQNTAIRVTVGGNGGAFDQTFLVNSGYTNGVITRYFIPSVTINSAKLRFTDLGVAAAGNETASTTYAGAILDGIYLGDVPEPTTFALVGLGVAALAVARRKRA